MVRGFRLCVLLPREGKITNVNINSSIWEPHELTLLSNQPFINIWRLSTRSSFLIHIVKEVIKNIILWKSDDKLVLIKLFVPFVDFHLCWPSWLIRFLPFTYSGDKNDNYFLIKIKNYFYSNFLDSSKFRNLGHVFKQF